MRSVRFPIQRFSLVALAIGALLFCAGSHARAQSGLQFNGSSQYVTFGTAAGLGTATFTLETWFKRTGAGATTSTGTGGVTAVPLVTKGRGEADGNNRDCNYFFGIRSSDNVLAADFEEGATGASPGLNHPVAGVTAIANNIWYHAAVTYDGNKWQLFLNGNLENELVVGQPPRSDCIQHAGLATAMTSTGSREGYFAGEMDEVRIWNRALSQAEIQAGKGVEVNSGSGLLGRWGLNETSGTIAYNSVPTGPNGTLGGTPTRTAGAPSLLAIPTATAASGITTTEFTANWNAVTGATDYRLDVSTSNTFDAFVSGYNDLTVTGTSQNVTGLTLGTTYYYRVRAVGVAGTTGNSNTMTVTTVGLPPAAPTELIANVTIGTQINLTWTDNSDNELNFEIERSTDGGAIFDPLATVAAGTQAYFDEGLTAASNYTYRVRATNNGGSSDWTSTASATTPASPNNSLHLGSSNAYVTFGAAPGLSIRHFTIEVWFKRTGTGVSNTTGGGGITLFPILSKGAPQAEGSVVDANYILGINATGNVLAADFEEGTGSVSPGLNHPVSGTTTIVNNVWYHAAATFAPNGDFKLYLNGNLEASAALGASRWPQGASTQHAALGTMIESGGTPHGYFAGVVEEARIWNYARTLSEIQATMNMQVPSAPGLLGRWGLNEVSGTTVQSSAGTTIDGTVTAGGWKWTTGTPLSSPPGAPTATAATGVTTNGFSANWDAVAGASSYKLDVSALENFSTFVSGYSDLTVGGTTQSVMGLAQNTHYYYRVRAVGDGGTSGNSNTINVTTLGTPPGSPTGLTVAATSYRTIQLSWTDDSDNEENFEIHRSTDGGSSFALLVSLGANVTSHIDATVGAGLPYCYRVRATNASGPSSYTSSECATTPAESKTALNLGASNAYVTFGSAMGLATQNFTVEVWFKRTGTGVSNTTGTSGMNIIPLVAKGSPEDDGSTVDANYILGINSDLNVIAADFEEGTGSTSVGLNHPISGTTLIVNNTWYHAAITFAPNGEYKLYLNGNLEAELALGASRYPQGASIQHAALGAMVRSGGTANGFFAGVLDEARIWNVPHTQAEIQSMMNSPITTPQTGLLGRYGFGEGSGTAIYCGAGATIDGTLTGTGATWTTDSPFNAAPAASDVSITGAALVNELLTGNYTYGDADGDLEGVSTFRWLADNVAIGGATSTTYTLTANELGKLIKFEVTPVAQTGSSPGAPVQSTPFGPVTLASLTITASAGANGSISPLGSVPVTPGADQSFTMTPNPGYHLGGLVVDGATVNPVSPYVFANVTAPHSIDATFAQDSYPVAAIGPVGIDLNGDGTNDMRINFSKLPAGGGTVAPVLFLVPPAGAPVPPSGALPYYLMISSTIANHSFAATVTMDMDGVTGFETGSELVYYNDATKAWVLVPGTYMASDASFGGHPSFTFETDHFTSFAFYEAGAGLKSVFVSADPAIAMPGTIVPNDSWGPVTAYDPNDWSWTGSEPVSVYIVPEAGLEFGACDITLEWDATVLDFTAVEFGAAGSPNGLFGSGQSYPSTTDTDRLSTTNRVRINCAVLDGTNVTAAVGAYIARVDFSLLRPGHSAVALIDADFRAFVDGAAASAVQVFPRQAEVRAYLGDVATAGPPIDESKGDGVIDFDDLVPWSYSYFSGTDLLGTMDNYMTKYDIGSAAGRYVFTLPTPDSKIDFEDLVIFSISYGLSATSQLPKIQAPPATPVEVSLGAPLAVAGETRIPVVLEGDVTDLRALHLELTGQFESFLGADKGTLTQSYTTPVTILGKASGCNLQVDCAVLGLGADAVRKAGELLILRFAGKPRVHLAATAARSSGNLPLNTLCKKGAGDYQPVNYSLSQNYPNPFNPATTIDYEVPTAGPVKVEVYNLLGELVTTLVEIYREPGFYTTQWNGEDAAGRTVGSGIYLYRLRSGSFTAVRKMILLK